MTRLPRPALPCLTIVLACLTCLARPASIRGADDSFRLQYRFEKGEDVRTKVTHVATTETRIRGNTQESRSRTVSTKLWRITDIDPDGNITFEHMVQDIEMWQKVTGREERRYNSKTDKDPARQFQGPASTIGKVLATVKISPSGEVLQRKSNVPEFSLGLGPIATPLPEKTVKIGETWNHPSELTVQLPDKKFKKIQTRLSFKLLTVKTGVATISVRTQVLTPVTDPEIKSQLVQQLTNGTLKFDVDAGRILNRRMDWDETVVGFNGADSLMEYLARYTEEALPVSTASSPINTVR